MNKLRIKILGIVIAIMGVVMILYTGVNAAQAENTMDPPNSVGTAENGAPIQWSPIVGLGLLLGGIVLLSDKQQDQEG